jgi:hypothetical protein
MVEFKKTMSMEITEEQKEKALKLIAEEIKKKKLAMLKLEEQKFLKEQTVDNNVNNNYRMTRKLILSASLALVIGTLTGYFNSKEKFYYLEPSSPKNEITKLTYEQGVSSDSMASDIEKWAFYQKEEEFNFSLAVIVAALSLGSTLILFNLKKEK